MSALGIAGLRVGVLTDTTNHTGCTVVLPPSDSTVGFAVRGGAPGTRESAVLSVGSANHTAHALVLCGSSLFGLRAADGVVDWCVEQGIGLQLPGGVFPIVGAAVVMDIQSPDQRRLSAADGRAACEAATEAEPPQGSVGVGTGCTVGKEGGRDWGSKGGQGWATLTSGELTVSALMAVNAFGSVYGPDGRIVAGSRAPDSYPRYPESPPHRLYDAEGVPVGRAEWGSLSEEAAANTVIGVVTTNARLTKPAACRVADLAHTGIARRVDPAHTSMDGDALFTVATGEVEASVDQVSHLAGLAVAEAILNGVRHATAMPGWPVDPRSQV